MNSYRFGTYLVIGALTLAHSLAGAAAHEKTQNITVTATDQAAAASTSPSSVHALGLSGVNRQAMWITEKPVGQFFAAGKHSNSKGPSGFFPGDVSDPSHGPVVTFAESHGIYVNCLPNCWGTPASFLNDLGESQMIHIADAYVGAFANDRYTVGTGGLLTGTLPPVLYDADIIAIAHAGGAAFGTGYHHIYHIFLPPGQDVCFTGSSPLECYSPDNPSTFYFCAYHASVDFSDIGHVLLTVEPFQNVPGCQVQAPSPNGLLVDSTADVLSHETFETITDPDGDAWWNHFDLALFGSEIADECQDFNFGYNTVNLNGKSYEIQPEYSNFLHGCVTGPFNLP